jgi:hypothetical protein
MHHQGWVRTPFQAALMIDNYRQVSNMTISAGCKDVQTDNMPTRTPAASVLKNPCIPQARSFHDQVVHDGMTSTNIMLRPSVHFFHPTQISNDIM